MYLQHILDVIVLIEKYARGKTFEDVSHDTLLQDGLVRQLTIIGEAGNQISATLQDVHPEIPWSDMVGMRNILVHRYFGVDLAEAWKTTLESVPRLKTQITAILRTL